MRLYAVFGLIATLAFAPLAEAQVFVPRTGTLNSAQPQFCVDPATGTVKDCAGTAASPGYVLPGSVTPTAPTSTLATGGVAQSFAVTHGGYICNPLSTTDQGLGATEVIYVNPVTTATAAGNAGTSNLAAGQCFNFPPGMTTNLSWIAATTGHKANIVVY